MQLSFFKLFKPTLFKLIIIFIISFVYFYSFANIWLAIAGLRTTQLGVCTFGYSSIVFQVTRGETLNPQEVNDTYNRFRSNMEFQNEVLYSYINIFQPIVSFLSPYQVIPFDVGPLYFFHLLTLIPYWYFLAFLAELIYSIIKRKFKITR